MKKVGVTGASGHIGFNVACELLKRGYETHLFIRKENLNIFKLKQKGAQVHVCDLLKPETYAAELKGLEGVFHLAAENTTKKANENQVIQNTLGITEVFLNTCIEQKINRIIYTSSVVVLGRSESRHILINENDKTKFVESPYVEGKVKAEEFVDSLVREKDIDIRRVYPSWVVGPGDPKMTPPHKIITDYVGKGQPFYFPGGISLASVEEIARAQVKLFEKEERQGCYVLAGDNITFKEFYTLLSSYTRFGRPKIKFPKWLIVMGARFTAPVFRLFGMEPILEVSYAKSVFGNYSWYDSTKAVRDLDYQIQPAKQLLSDAVFEANKRISSTTNLGIQYRAYQKTSAEGGKLLITGAPGWLANRMIDIMINGDKDGEFQSNRAVRLLVQKSHAGLLDLPANFEIVYGDITNKKDVLDALEGVESVFHIAGAIYPSKIKTLYAVNERGTKNIVDACIEKNIRRIIYMSTDSVCGRGTKKKRVFDEHSAPTPYRNYGKSKYLGEKYLLEKSHAGFIDATALRGFWFFGPFAPPRQLNFLNMFSWPRQLVFGNGKNYRSTSHVDDIVQAFFKAENNSNTYGKWYWIAGNEHEMTVDELYENIAKGLNTEYKPLHLPNWMCGLFGILDKLLGMFGYLHPSIHAAGKFHFDIAGKIDAAKRDFDYNPKFSFQDTARQLKELY
jgi:dihydroflavonol-4-reductase